MQYKYYLKLLNNGKWTIYQVNGNYFRVVKNDEGRPVRFRTAIRAHNFCVKYFGLTPKYS